MDRLWVTGYRSFELNVFNDKDPKITVIKYALKNYLVEKLEDAELDWVITGANLGVEQWTAELMMELRQEYDVRFSVMIPYMNFAERWNENNQAKFLNIKEGADFFASTSNSPYTSPAQLKNYQRFMVNHTDRALMIYDPEHPGKPKYDYQLIKNQQKIKDYPLDLIDFYDLEDAANEYEEANRRKNYY